MSRRPRRGGDEPSAARPGPWLFACGSRLDPSATLAPPPGLAGGREPRAGGVAALVGAVTVDELEIALAATIVVAAPDTEIPAPEGRSPRLEGTPARLVRRLGPWGALGFWTASDPWDADAALAAGLVDRLDPDPVGRARSVLDAWRRAPVAADALRRLLRAGDALDERGARDLERALFSLAFADDRPRAGAREFLDRRSARGD